MPNKEFEDVTLLKLFRDIQNLTLHNVPRGGQSENTFSLPNNSNCYVYSALQDVALQNDPWYSGLV